MDTEKNLGILDIWRAWQTAANLAERTMVDRDYVMRHFFRYTHADPLAITADEIMVYCSRPGLSPSARSTYHKAIRAYCKFLVRSGRRADDPSAATPVPRQPRGVPRPVGDGDLPRILAAANRRRTRMMVLLASLQGLRVHEIAKIAGEDVDVAAGRLLVTGKGNKTAYLPLHETVGTFALEDGFPASGWWFPSYSKPGGHITPAGVTTAISSTMRRAGVRGTPHQLRHWYGTSLVQNGVDLRTVQELLRHSSLATTQIYTKVSDVQQRAAIGTLRIAS